MKTEFLELKNENILKLGIKDEFGNPTGEYLEFDLEDIELPLIYQEIMENARRNRICLKKQFIAIEKKQDHKGKKLLSSNDEEKVKALNEFYKKETENYNMFLGKNGVQKLLNGRKIRLSTFEQIDKMIEDHILPKLEVMTDNMINKIKGKYSNKKEDNILE